MSPMKWEGVDPPPSKKILFFQTKLKNIQHDLKNHFLYCHPGSVQVLMKYL